MAEEMFVLEGPQSIREGETVAPAIVWPGYTSVSSGTTEAYKNGSSCSAGCLSGADSVTGNVHNAQTFTPPAGYGGSWVVLECGIDVTGGSHLKTAIAYYVMKPGAEP
jgi:hypothetical protein